MVLSWIINYVSKDIIVSIICVDTDKVMWTNLKDRYSQQNGPRIFQIQKSISDLRQEKLSASNYFTILKRLWDGLLNYKPLPPCTCGTMKVHNEYQQQEYVMQFLMGLNESYACAKGQILKLNIHS
jgi:mannose/fructose/N-acetylgalactosamine-specific phosphotransferase system component IIB